MGQSSSRGGREGIDVPGYRPGGIAELPGRQIARKRREVRDQYRYRPRQGRLVPPLLLIVVVVPATPPPIAAATTAMAQELGVRAGGGYYYFVLFVCLAGGIWSLARSRHINFPTTIVTIVVVLNSYMHLGAEKGRVQNLNSNPEGMSY